MEPDAVLIQDRTLLESVNVFGGLTPNGYVLINSSHSVEELGLEDLATKLPKGHLITLPATEYAMKHIKRPLPGAAMLCWVCRSYWQIEARKHSGSVQN